MKKAAELFLPPQNEVAEISVIGSVLIDPQILGPARERIIPTDFYNQGRRKAWELFCELSDNGSPIDVTTVYGGRASRVAPIWLRPGS